jgi:hypothetical protein
LCALYQARQDLSHNQGELANDTLVVVVVVVEVTVVVVVVVLVVLVVEKKEDYSGDVLPRASVSQETLPLTAHPLALW